MKEIIPADSDVWTKFRNGDNESLSLIYTKNAGKLYLYGLKLTPNHTLIEDSIQDLFSDLVRTRAKLGTTDNIHFYLLKSFKRRLLRQIQKEKRYNLRDQDYSFTISYSVEHEIILEERSVRKAILLRNALNDLTPRQKEAIYLKFTEQLEYEEISDILEMSVESCRNLICRAIKSLKESLQTSTSFILLLLRTKTI